MDKQNMQEESLTKKMNQTELVIFVVGSLRVTAHLNDC